MDKIANQLKHNNISFGFVQNQLIIQTNLILDMKVHPSEMGSSNPSELNKGTEMRLQTIKQLCLRDSLPEQPELNEKLYLYEQGFYKIQNLDLYVNVVSLWLNNNRITKIQGLNQLKNLVCLYLNDNRITHIEGLEQLSHLEMLNLEKNKISKLENLDKLSSLKNLNVARNYLASYDSISHLQHLHCLSTLDISNNEIENSQPVVNLIKSLHNLVCLSLSSSPLARGYKNYRKNMIAALTNLKFFDERPVQESDHRICEAWLKGGNDSQKKEREKIKSQQQRKVMQSIKQQTNYDFHLPTHTSQKTFQKQSIKTVKLEQRKQSLIKEEVQKIEPQQFEQKQENMKQNEDTIFQVKQSIEKVNLIPSQWKPEYERLLEALLEKYKFQFSEVQPRLNMILAEINKKLSRPTVRFEIAQLQKIWTQWQMASRKYNRK